MRRNTAREPGRPRAPASGHAKSATLSESRGTPQGTLRIATLSLLGELLTPAIAELLLRQPRLRVEVSLAETHVDLVAQEYDLALRTGPLADSSLVALIAGLMAVGLLAGCGGMPEAAPVESAEPGTRSDSLYHAFICCDGTECTSTVAIRNQYCQQEERGGICS